MAATRLYTLEPGRTLRAGGRDGACDPWIRSDTLAAALCCQAMETGVLAGAFERGAPPFRVSSVFYECGGVRLFPRPLGPPPDPPAAAEDPGARARIAAAWKRVRWVSESRLEALAAGRRARFEPAGEPEEAGAATVWALESERREIRTLPAILAPGAGHRPEALWIPEGTRLFFLARLEDEAIRRDLDELVALLGESGLGGARSTGAGRFLTAGSRPAPAFLSESVNPEDSPPAGCRQVLLSLYLPSRQEIERGILDGAAVEDVTRGGWIRSGGATALRKRPVRMLAEGSVLPAAAAPLAGAVVDARPEGFGAHPVWRDGRPVALRCSGYPGAAFREAAG